MKKCPSNFSIRRSKTSQTMPRCWWKFLWSSRRASAPRRPRTALTEGSLLARRSLRSSMIKCFSTSKTTHTRAAAAAHQHWFVHSLELLPYGWERNQSKSLSFPLLPVDRVGDIFLNREWLLVVCRVASAAFTMVLDIDQLRTEKVHAIVKIVNSGLMNILNRGPNFPQQ